MSNFTNLLAQTTSTSAAAPETLADTLRRHAKDLTDTDLTVLVAGFREQCTRWSAAQAAGSREKITTKKIKPAELNLSGFAIKKPTL